MTPYVLHGQCNRCGTVVRTSRTDGVQVLPCLWGRCNGEAVLQPIKEEPKSK